MSGARQAQQTPPQVRRRSSGLTPAGAKNSAAAMLEGWEAQANAIFNTDVEQTAQEQCTEELAELRDLKNYLGTSSWVFDKHVGSYTGMGKGAGVVLR